MNIIENTKDLELFCKEIAKEKFITVDLEFLREKTYYAELCLIQIGSEASCAIVDPLAKDIDLKSFFDIMNNKKILKVFHSCRQDIEILYKMIGKIPTPIFDTQVAAMVCGYGESISYESLVNKIAQKELDKTSRLSNWSKRPLSEKQLKYAMSDVTHLIEIYKNLDKNLKEHNRENWLLEEMEIIKTPSTYAIDPKEAWHKIRHRSHNRKFLTMLQALAAWREERAQRKDIARQFIVRDECLLSIAAAAPIDFEQLSQVRNIRKDILNGKLSTEILEVIVATKQIKSDKYVELPQEKIYLNFSNSLYELLKLLLKILSQEKGVVAKIIANDEDLRSFASENDKDNPILKGWRKDIFGKYAIKIRDGKISISYNTETKKIDIVETE